MNALYDSFFVAKIFISIFLSIVFLQSAIDKLLSWKTNVTWLSVHFEKTPLKNFVPALVGTITFTELITGVLALIGIFAIIIFQDDRFTYFALIGSLLTYLMLLLGQRIAKDYDGARTIVMYFAVSLLGMFLFV